MYRLFRFFIPVSVTLILCATAYPVLAHGAVSDTASSTPEIPATTATDASSTVESASSTPETPTTDTTEIESAASTDATSTASTIKDTTDATTTEDAASSTADIATTTESTPAVTATSSDATSTANTPVDMSATSSKAADPAPLQIDVPATCTATDTTNVAHTFPDASSSPSGYLAICMLEAAKDTNLISAFELVNNPSFGLYLQSVDGIEPGATEYWALWLNGQYTPCGIDCTPIAAGDQLSITLTDWTTNAESKKIVLAAHSLIATTTDATTSAQQETTPAPAQNAGGNGPVISGGGGGTAPAAPSAIQGALSFLLSKQQSNGSFGDTLYTDWAAIALASSGVAQQNLIALESSSAGLATLTDFERRALAQEALDIDPNHSGAIDHILSGFDGTQFGDPHEVNDDIFALLSLSHAGYTASDPVLSRDVAFVLAQQAPDGSWDTSVDLTAAAIEALEPLTAINGAPAALANARAYLKAHQHADGCFGNSFTTSWVLQAIAALGESPAQWQTISGADPLACLANLQQPDGGFEATASDTNNRIWATSYAIPALAGKSWTTLLNNFSRANSASRVAVTPTDNAATSTPVVDPNVATTTPVATTSPLLPPAPVTQTPPSIAPTIPTLHQPTAQHAHVVVRVHAPAPVPQQPSPSQQTAAAANSGINLVLSFSRFISSLWQTVISDTQWL